MSLLPNPACQIAASTYPKQPINLPVNSIPHLLTGSLPHPPKGDLTLQLKFVSLNHLPKPGSLPHQPKYGSLSHLPKFGSLPTCHCLAAYPPPANIGSLPHLPKFGSPTHQPKFASISFLPKFRSITHTPQVCLPTLPGDNLHTVLKTVYQTP